MLVRAKSVESGGKGGQIINQRGPYFRRHRFRLQEGMVQHGVTPTGEDRGRDSKAHARPPFILHAYFMVPRLCHEAGVLPILAPLEERKNEWVPQYLYLLLRSYRNSPSSTHSFTPQNAATIGVHQQFHQGIPSPERSVTSGSCLRSHPPTIWILEVNIDSLPFRLRGWHQQA